MCINIQSFILLKLSGCNSICNSFVVCLYKWRKNLFTILCKVAECQGENILQDHFFRFYLQFISWHNSVSMYALTSVHSNVFLFYKLIINANMWSQLLIRGEGWTQHHWVNIHPCLLSSFVIPSLTLNRFSKSQNGYNTNGLHFKIAILSLRVWFLHLVVVGLANYVVCALLSGNCYWALQLLFILKDYKSCLHSSPSKNELATT